jgi:gliding motility-associated-like protein
MLFSCASITMFCLLLSSPYFQLTEICDNALDDDQDGFIDLNDEDCTCSTIELTSLIPNPSFEEMNCCPGLDGLLSCASSWVQASAADVHYFHDCSFTNPLIPQPIPDGQGVVALSNGRIGEQSNYKEYLGACLTEPMQAGVPYKLRLQVGISPVLDVIPMEVSLFGVSECSNLPFGGTSDTIGCPTNAPNWVFLGQAEVSNLPGWKDLEIAFTPTTDLKAFAIGPPCAPLNWQDSTKSAYYFLDNLTLAKAYNFDFEVLPSGPPCEEGLTLTAPLFAGLTYQWYRNGIAILGADRNVLETIDVPGNYQVSLRDDSGCLVSPSYQHSPSIAHYEYTDTLCPQSGYAFWGRHITEPGNYSETLETAEGCDSIVRLSLVPDTRPPREITARIFPDDTYRLGDFQTNRRGLHTFYHSEDNSCGELIILHLDYYSAYVPNVFSPNGDGINDKFAVFGGTDLEEVRSLQVFDRWGGLVYQQENLSPNNQNSAWDGKIRGKPAAEGVFVYVAEILMNDGNSRTLSGKVSLLR